MKVNVFDKIISVWTSVARSAGNRCEVSMGVFLNAGERYLSIISHARQLYEQALAIYDSDPAQSLQLFGQYSDQKRKLPLATISGNYSCSGRLEDLLQATSAICLDIDQTKPHKAAQLLARGEEIPNAHVTDWQTVKRKLSQLPFVAYCALSAGGHGVFCIVPIEHHHRHAQAWDALSYLFKKHLGLTVDPQTRDITRPRFASHDPQPYVNPEAEVFTAVIQEKRTPPPAPRYTRTAPASSTEEAVIKCVEAIECKSIDITSVYHEWADIAAALFNGLGEAGKQYFQRVSAFYPHASGKEISQKWEQNKKRPQIGIGTFFHLCARHGIIYKQSPSLPLTHAQSAPSNDHARHKSDEQAHTHVSGTASRVFFHVAPIASYSALEDITQEQWDSLLSPEAVQRFRGH